VPYDAVFLDVDGTLLWVDLDVAGYVEDLAPYSLNGRLTVEKATGPVRESLRRHIKENVKHRTEDDLADFRLRNAETTARELGIEAPSDVLMRVADCRISFNPYPESEPVLRALRGMGRKLYVVSNWDIRLVRVLDDLGWTPFFEGIVVSAILGVEKPAPDIFEEALRLAGVDPEKALHVGNDPVTDVRGAREAGIDTVFVAREREFEDPGATFVIPDLTGLPEILEK
jgi:putative hydrolase of the HAD superfamily